MADVEAESVRSELERLLANERFAHSPSLSRFLRFTVEQAVQGHCDQLKEYVLGLAVFERGEAFDPRIDPIVRVQAGNLRHRLQQYYEGEGRDDPVVIEFPVGGYVPVFRHREAAARKPARAWRRAALLGGLALVASATAWWLLRTRPPEPWPPLTQLTFGTGSNAFPAISRDGKLLAYASDSGGKKDLDLYVKPLEGGEPVQLTRHPATDRSPDFSPDSRSIVFQSNRDRGGIYMLSLLSREETLLAEGGYFPRFSPDGRWVAYSGMDAKVHIVPSHGGPPRVVHPELEAFRGPIWTPEGAHLLFMARRRESGAAASQWDWWIAPLEGGPLVRTGAADMLRRQGLPAERNALLLGDWAGQELVFSVRQGQSANLWRIPISRKTWRVAGPARRLTFGPGSHTYPRVISGAGGRARVVCTTENVTTHVWALPLGPHPPESAAALEPLTNDASLFPGLLGTRARLSADGTKLVFPSVRTGNLDVWVKDLHTGKETRLTSNPWSEDRPLISPDGSRVAYESAEDGRRAIYVADTARPAIPREVCHDCGTPMDWTADGRQILYGAGEPPRLWLLDVESGRKTDLVKDPLYTLLEAAFSPEPGGPGWVALVAEGIGPGATRGFVAPFRDGSLPDPKEWIPVTENPQSFSLQWSSDGNTLYSLAVRDDFRCLWAYRLDPATKRPRGQPAPVHHFHQEQRYPWFGFSISVAQDKIALALTEATANIWMTEQGPRSLWGR